MASPGWARVEEEVVLSVVAREDVEVEMAVVVVSEANDERDEVVAEVDTDDELLEEVEELETVEAAGGADDEVET